MRKRVYYYMDIIETIHYGYSIVFFFFWLCIKRIKVLLLIIDDGKQKKSKSYLYRESERGREAVFTDKGHRLFWGEC